MSTDKEALARRAVKCTGWRWVEGMRDTNGWICVIATDDGAPVVWADGDVILREDDVLASDPAKPLPDLDHFGTLGCIEHEMLPAAWGEGCILSVKRWTTSDGTVMADIHVHEFTGACPMLFGVVDVPLAEALVMCLEAAAERREP